MAMIHLKVQVNGRPLRRAYVEHATTFGFVTSKMYVTDDEGRVRDERGDLGIDAGFGNRADVRVHCQNSVVRLLDGTRANIAVSQDKSGLADGETINLNTSAEQADHYEILNRALITYDVVFRQFRPFSGLSDPDYPLGRVAGLQASRDRKRRLEVSYPDQFPLPTLAFVEPKSLSTGFPLVHIRDRGTDGRLFGTAGQRPTLIPAELSHALHFSRFTEAQRQQIEIDYVGWITSEVAAGRSGTHDIGVLSTPQVAYLEALDHFSSRFAEFVRIKVQGGAAALQPQAMTVDIRRDFIASELGLSRPAGLGEPAVAQVVNDRVVPVRGLGLAGSNEEGSVYGCIFVDFAKKVGLRTAVNAYFQSAAAGAVTFGGYKSWVADNHPEHLATLENVQRTWDL